MPTRITNDNESGTYYLTKQTADIQYINQSGDTMHGDLDMSNNRITNVKYPIASGDAASKLFVELNMARITFPFKIIPLHINKEVTTNRVILITEELEAPGIINASQVFVIADHYRIYEDNRIRVQVIWYTGDS